MCYNLFVVNILRRVRHCLKIGDKVVYPMHGAGVIEAIEEKEVLGEKREVLYFAGFP